jgi:ATP-binding cassette subfamily B protein/subfamily B ATP-binding cassette protein MsbA
MTMQRYRKLIRYPLSQLPRLLVIAVLTVLTSLITALQPWPLKILVDYALGGKELPAAIHSFFDPMSVVLTPGTLVIGAAAAGFALFALNSALDLSLTWTWVAAGQRMVCDFAADLFHRLLHLSLRYHSRYSVGDALSRLTGDTYCVYTMTSNLLITPWQRGLTLVTVGIFAWNMDPALTLVSLAVAPVMAGSSLFFAPRLKQGAKLDREAQSRLMSFVHQTVTAIPIVQAFRGEKYNRERFRHFAADAVKCFQRKTLLDQSYTLVNDLISSLGTAVILFAAGKRVLSGSLTVGSLLVFLSYLASMQAALKGILGIYGNMKSTEAGIDRVLEILSSDDSIRERKGARPLPDFGESRGRHVFLEGVTFGYEPGFPVVQNVTLSVNPGETAALVGSTGAGKSTLVSLILRFYDPWEGRVSFDGIDVRDVKVSSLRSQVAIVLQESFLLPLTVAENIAYGRPGAGRAEIEAAAAAANAEEFIRRLPEGYDTVIGEGGSTLSGGQKQRLAIARALLKNAPVLIFDEPTSALDARTEALLLEATKRLMEGRTTFIIAHRLSAVRKADRIFVLEGGKIVETGSHQELIRTNGNYSRLYSLQFPDADPRRAVV